MNFQFQIREATPEDVPSIYSLVRDLAEYEKMSDEVVGTDEMMHESLFGEKAVAECILATIEDKAVGLALFFHNFSTFLAKPGIYLEDLFVMPEFRGQGIGKALLSRVAKTAVERNCGRMEWSVLDWNKPSIDFYDSLGAVQMSEWITCRLTGEPLLKTAELYDQASND